MDEFREARRLQRWGNAERLGRALLMLVILVGASLVLIRELKKGAGTC